MLRGLLTTAMVLIPVHSSAAKGSDLIVLVLLDAVRSDHVGIYGYQRPTTPNLDAFAKTGVRYTRAYVNAPWTRPSTASFLTGYNASRHRTETERSKLADSITTVVERLRKKGYVTAGFTANGNGGSLARLDKGFHHFEDTSKTYTREMRGKTYCCNGLPTGEFIARRAIRWMNANKAKKKFIFLFFVDPHDPYGAPPELEEMMLGEDFKGTVRRRALWERDNDYPKDERYSLMALYDAGIRYADQAFDQFTAYLKKRRLYESSTIFVTADHGEGFGEHGFYLHAHHFWEEVIHVPLIVRGPRFARDAVDNRLVDATDVSRTIVHLVGADAGDMPGYSLLEPPEKTHVISEYNEFGIHRQAIVGERYKVIWQRPADEQWYLRVAKKKEFFPSVVFGRERIRAFDLVADPEEKNDLAGAMPEEAALLLDTLRQFVSKSEKIAAKKR